MTDAEIEYQFHSRFSFMRFLEPQLEDRLPDANTVWLFRERLKHLQLIEVLFERFHQQLAAHGYVAHVGHMVDATFSAVPRQRSRREENVQKRFWIRRRMEAATNRRFMPIAPAVPRNTKKNWLPTTYLARFAGRVCGATSLTDAQKESNWVKSKVRVRVEHVFSAQAQRGGHIVHTMGLKLTRVKIGMMNLVYNMKRLVQLIVRDTRVSGKAAGALTGKVHPQGIRQEKSNEKGPLGTVICRIV